jgi:MFS transporter
MVSVTYGIRPYGGHPTGWTSPRVIALLGSGIASLIAFAFIERRAEDPMFRLPLLKIRAFTFGTLSTFLAAVARGGLMFMLIIWLQGIWLPLHGYSFTDTPLWAGIYMLPLTVGMLLSGPTSGYLSDRFGARPFATGGMLAAALSFALLALLPTDFAYPAFAAVLFMNGVAMGLFASPNRAAVMNSLPPGDRFAPDCTRRSRSRSSPAWLRRRRRPCGAGATTTRRFRLRATRAGSSLRNGPPSPPSEQSHDRRWSPAGWTHRASPAPTRRRQSAQKCEWRLNTPTRKTNSSR